MKTLALALLAAAAVEAPVLVGSSATPEPPQRHDLVVFKGTLLFNEHVYRALLRLPASASATQETARDVAAQLAHFLAEAGYDLAKVRAQVRGSQIEVHIDEGALDKIILSRVGWLTALRFRAALNLPLDVFNRRVFDAQMRQLARQFGMRDYRYELWPVHMLDDDNAMKLPGIEELRALPFLRPARGYELRVFAESEPWGTGFSPEVIVNGSVGLAVGGRYRWKDILQKGDRWQTHFRVGGGFRDSLDANATTRVVNTVDYLTARWLSPAWGGAKDGLRITIAPRGELWTLQRGDLHIDTVRVATGELVGGFGAQLTSAFALYFNLGLQRRWVFGLQTPQGATLLPDVNAVPNVSNRVFVRFISNLTFNPEEMRQDLRNVIALDMSAFRPTMGNDVGFLRLDLQGRRSFAIGWHELRLGARLTGETGDIWYLDEIPLNDHLRIGFGLAKYTHRVASLSLELRWSLARDKVKIGAFNDLGVWRHLPRDDPGQKPDVAGSAGAGLFFLLFDELQVDMYYGIGWSTDNYRQLAFALSIKEAF